MTEVKVGLFCYNCYMIIEFIKDFVFLSLHLILLFMLISFIVAFTQKQFSEKKIKNLLQGNHDYSSAIRGAAIGFLTPFCSCSAIPLLLALIQADVPFCATIAYLMASPLLNPIVMVLFIGFFGLQVTILYVILTFSFSVLIGVVIHKLGFEDYVKSIKPMKINQCRHTHVRQRAKFAIEDCLDVFKKIFPHLLLGAFIATLIHGFVPEKFINNVINGNSLYVVPLASFLGLPLHIHPETMFPIAKILIEKNVSIGTIIALIIAGSGVSLPEITMLYGIFRRRIIFVFVLSVFLVAIISGYIFNLLF